MSSNHQDYIDFVYQGLKIPRIACDESEAERNVLAATTYAGVDKKRIAIPELQAHDAFAQFIKTVYPSQDLIDNYKRVESRINQQVDEYKRKSMVTLVNEYVLGMSFEMNKWLAHWSLRNAPPASTTTLSNGVTMSYEQLQDLESHAMTWEGPAPLLLCRRISLPESTPSCLMLNGQSPYLTCYENVAPHGVMWNAGWTSCAYGIEETDKMQIRLPGHIKPIRPGTEYPPFGFQGTNVFMAIVMLPGARYMPVQTTEENPAEREIILPSNTFLYVCGRLNIDVGGQKKTFILALYGPSYSTVEAYMATMQAEINQKYIQYLKAHLPPQAQTRGGSRKIVYLGRRYTVRKEGRRCYIVVKGAMTYLKDIKGKYKTAKN